MATETLQEDSQEPDMEVPSISELAESCIGIMLDVENSLDEDTSPDDQVLNLTMNAGRFLNLLYFSAGCFQEALNFSEEEMDEFENMVMAGKRLPVSSGVH
jgi:hypothetical protein